MDGTSNTGQKLGWKSPNEEDMVLYSAQHSQESFVKKVMILMNSKSHTRRRYISQHVRKE